MHRRYSFIYILSLNTIYRQIPFAESTSVSGQIYPSPEWARTDFYVYSSNTDVRTSAVAYRAPGLQASLDEIRSWMTSSPTTMHGGLSLCHEYCSPHACKLIMFKMIVLVLRVTATLCFATKRFLQNEFALHSIFIAPLLVLCVGH